MSKFFLIGSIVFFGGLVSCSASDVNALKLENELLRKEIQSLHRQLVLIDKNAPDAAEPRSEKVASNDAQAGEYIMSSSGKRHNSRCRYYSSKGRACSATEQIEEGGV